MYKIIQSSETHQASVVIYSNEKRIKKWQGKFAQSIIEQILNKYNTEVAGFYLCSGHLSKLLKDISNLYRISLIHYKIESSLQAFSFSKNKYNIAEVLLLHIRMNKHHLTKDELFTIFLDEFPNYNFLKFYEILEIFIENKIILAIQVNKETIFYDKNPVPHKHFYVTNHNKLYDCNSKEAGFFESVNAIYKDEIYYI